MDSARVHVVVGTEGLLVERAVAAIVDAARASAGDGGMGLPGGAGDAVDAFAACRPGAGEHEAPHQFWRVEGHLLGHEPTQ